MNEPLEQKPHEETLLLFTAVLAGCLVAASQQQYVGFTGLLGAYLYWIIRVVAEAMMFVSVRYAVRKYLPQVKSFFAVTGLAAALSLIPFVLVVIAADIILGTPELGLNPELSMLSRLAAFGMAMISLADNHFVLCALLTLPSILASFFNRPEENPDTVDGENAANDSGTILSSIEPPLSDPILWAEAREDYVKLVTSNENRMVLNRFSDILRELPSDAGIRVHRSHWVAYSAVSELYRDGSSLQVRLKTDDVIPVSQSYRTAAEVALSRVVS